MKATLLLVFIRNLVIVLVLLGLILVPRPAAGILDRLQADRLEAAGDFAAAADAYATAARRLPWQPSLWEKAGMLAQRNGNLADSLTYLNRAVTQNVISGQGWLSLGIAYQQSGDMSLAMNAWEHALPLAEAYRYLAQDQRALESFPAAIDSWRAYLVQAPGDAPARYQLGLLLMTTSPEEALPELMQAAQVDPALEASVHDLRSALNIASLSDDDAYQFLISGRALGAQGYWDLAETAFQNAIALRGDYAEAWGWLAEAKQQQGQDGSNEMDRAIALAPDSAMLQSLYGLYLQRQKKPDLALAAIQKAAALEPNNSGWQMALGEAYEQTGDLVAALAHYQRAVALAPGEAIAWQALAQFSLRNNVDLAGTGLPAVLQMLELSNDNWQSDDLAGQILLGMGDLVGAEAVLKKALELDPTQAAPALHLGLLYLRNGDSPAAYSYLNQARIFDPNGPEGWQANRLLEQYFP